VRKKKIGKKRGPSLATLKITEEEKRKAGHEATTIKGAFKKLE